MSSLPYTESWLPGPQNTSFYTRLYTPSSPKAAVVFIHGFAEHVGRYNHIHPLFPQHNIALFTFDQRGFGRTALDEEAKKKGNGGWGKTSWDMQMQDITWALGIVKEKYGDDIPVFLMGHSMGGAVVLGYAISHPTPNIAGVISTSPLIQQTKPASKVLRWIGSKASVLSPWTLFPAELDVNDLSHDSAFNTAYANDPLIKASGSLKGISDMLGKGDELHRTLHRNWPTKLPVLFVHGTGDKVTSHKATQAFHDNIKVEDRKIILFDDGYHELHNEPDGVKDKLMEEVFRWIEERVLQGLERAKM
ncbi:putative lysophospholipase [Moniliophthora roreri]|uniref:Serine aminopeptidase S33 domain-containing protein n=1 Tax=Moniliophthora roreri TaxID=221103 RepID=A0A0W0GDF7_MONRR|nr:putative lysophospholipase [Moniliophthora roreri]